MQVGLVTGQRLVQLREFPEPIATAGRSVVQISFCGICGTDVHAYLSGEPYNPAICGHEWVGHVSANGPGVQHVKEGDRVGVGVAAACGQCATCAAGDAAHCETVLFGMIGVGPMAAPHGGFASAISIDASRLFPVVASLSDADAAILEPLTIAAHAVRRTPIRMGDLVVVIGGGPIGQLVLQCARAAGAGTVVVIEPQPARRKLASTLGAHFAIDPRETDPLELLRDQLRRPGADVVFECAGVPQTVHQAVTLTRRGGVVSLVGVPSAPSQVNIAEWLMKEIRLVTSLGYERYEFDVAQAMLADGRVQVRALHTATVGLSGLAGAFDRLASAPEEVKILVDPRIA